MKLRVLIAVMILPLYIYGQKMRHVDKIRIAEAVNIVNTYGNSLWGNFDKAPFAILLVTEGFEYLMFHNNPSDDFKKLEFDTLLNTNIYCRTRKFSTKLLATFPAVGGISCIVVGTPEGTGRSSSDWIITLIHEHFHQYVTSSQNYNAQVDALNLSKGDQTGMWMLNYDFAYTDENVQKVFQKYTSSIEDVLKHIDEGISYNESLKNYMQSRKEFKSTLSHDDYKYFSFQLWQEGIARYTEYKFLELLSNYQPSKAIQALDDFIPFYEFKTKLKNKELKNLTSLKLKDSKRVCFYAVGMAEGLLLDHLNPNWRGKYLSDKFFLEKYRK